MSPRKNGDQPARNIVISPVGEVRSPLKEPSLFARCGHLRRSPRATSPRQELGVVSEIAIDTQYHDLLDGIEEFSHLLVLYWAHRVSGEGRSVAKAHPMGRKDLPLVGIFATCSPARPNPVCATVVQLLERRGNVLRVQGLDAIDGSPVLDVKPYNPSYYPDGEVRLAAWMERIRRDIALGLTPGAGSDEECRPGLDGEGNAD